MHAGRRPAYILLREPPSSHPQNYSSTSNLRTQAHTSPRAILLKDAPKDNPLIDPALLISLGRGVRDALTRRLLQDSEVELALSADIVGLCIRDGDEGIGVLRIVDLSGAVREISWLLNEDGKNDCMESVSYFSSKSSTTPKLCQTPDAKSCVNRSFVVDICATLLCSTRKLLLYFELA